MTQRQSWPLIGIDYHGNEHPYEQEAYTQGEAGRKLTQYHGDIVKVFLDCSKIRVGKLAGQPRKLVYSRPGYEEHTTGVGAGLLGEAISQARLDVAGMLVRDFAKRGLRLEIDVQEDRTDVFVKPKGKATQEDRELIEQHKDTLIAFITQRDATEKAARETSTKQDDHSGQKLSRRETLRRILPELPNDFSVTDVQKQLRSWNDDEFNKLADDVKSINNVLHWAVQEGFIARAKRGHYMLLERAFVPRPTPIRPDVADIVEPEPPAPPDTTPPPEPAQRALETIQPASESSPPILQGTDVQEALIRVVAELGSGNIDDSTINQAEKAINNVLEAVTSALDPIEAMLKSIRQINAHKSQLLKTLSGLKAP